jgi:hypothetical protein
VHFPQKPSNRQARIISSDEFVVRIQSQIKRELDELDILDLSFL